MLGSLCGMIYRPVAILNSFDHFDAGLDDGVCWGLKRLPAFDVVVFRGSITLQDWVRDIRAAAVPSRVGHVHAGFYAGMENVWTDVRPMLSQPAIVVGHSLGAARADILAALMVVDGTPPVDRVVLGEPKPGLMDFAHILEGVPGRSYRNGDATHHDLVTDLPFSFPPFEYVHPTPVVPICCRPDVSEFQKMGVFAYHHIDLYETALAVRAPREHVIQ